MALPLLCNEKIIHNGACQSGKPLGLRKKYNFNKLPNSHCTQDARLSALPVNILNPIHGLSVADFAQIPLGSGQIRMAENDL